MSLDDVRNSSLSQVASAVAVTGAGTDTSRGSPNAEAQRWSRGSKKSVQNPVISLVKIEHPLENSYAIPGVVTSGKRESDIEGRRISAVSVGAVAPTPKEHLPPSPPLTRVGTDDSLRESARSGKNVCMVRDNRRSLDTALDYGPEGDISTRAVDPYRHEEIYDEQQAQGQIEKFVAAIPTSSNPTPSSSSSVDMQLPPLSQPIAGASHTSPASPPYRSETKGTLLSPLPSPTQSHPLYRPPSPQPWDLVDPPPSNNSNVAGLWSTRMFANDDEERKNATGTSTKREESVVEGKIIDIVVKDGKRYRIPHSMYYNGPPSNTSAYGTNPIGHIGVHHPREIVRIERDYAGGEELIQFSPAYPLELEGRLSPTQFLETINSINELLISAHNLRWSLLDNAIAIVSLYISRLFLKSHYEKEMDRLKTLIGEANKRVYNPVGLNILWPRDVAFLFLEIEYY